MVPSAADIADNGSPARNLSERASGALGSLYLRQARERLRKIRRGGLQRGQQRVEGRVLLRQAGGERRHLLLQLGALLGERVFLLHAAVILIAELRGSLDVRRGGPLAQNLSNLYEYMTRRLMHANLNGDAAAVTEVLGLLGEIRGAWAAIGPEVRVGSAPKTASAA